MLAATAAGLAWGQPLKLDGPATLAPGECTWVLGAADRLTEAPGVAEVRALRLLAASMLRAAERAAPASPRAVLLAATFADRLPELEAGLAGLDPAARALLAKDAEALALAPPTDADALAIAVRDLCAPLAAAGGGKSPWTPGDASPAPAADCLAALRARAPELAGALGVIEARLAMADGSPAYAALAAETRRRLTGASRLATAPPGWLTQAARQALMEQVADAVRRAAEEPQSLETWQRLERLIVLGRAAAGLDAARGTSLAAGRAALAAAASAGPAADPTRRRGELRRLEGAARAAEMLPVRESLRDEKRVVRQFRPALKTMLELARLTEQDLLEALPGTLGAEGEDAINDPRFIAAVAAHRRRLDDLAVIIDASDAILRAQPAAPGTDRAAREEYKFLGDRLLAYAKDAVELAGKNDPLARDDLERALSRVRLLAEDCRDFALFPGEDALRGAAGKSGLLGKHGPGLLKAVEAERGVWLKRWASPDRPPLEEGARLRRLHGLMTTLCDAAEAEAMAAAPQRAAGPNGWPGWEMPGATLAALSTGLSQAVDAACTAGLAKGDDGRALRALVDRHAAVLLAGRLGRLFAGAGTPAAAELSAGEAPRSTPMRDRLEDLARVCREARELAEREGRGAAGAEGLRASVSRTARACLADAPLPPPPPPAPPPTAPPAPPAPKVSEPRPPR